MPPHGQIALYFQALSRNSAVNVSPNNHSSKKAAHGANHEPLPCEEPLRHQERADPVEPLVAPCTGIEYLHGLD
jgi:hypothetical protein